MLKFFSHKTIYPPSCVICDKRGYDNADICFDCYSDLECNKNACIFCASVLSVASNKQVCASCLKKRPVNYNKIISPFIYVNQARTLIHMLKFQHKYAVGKVIAQLICKQVAIETDLLTPIPLHKKKLKKRGFNQCAIIAEEISKITNIPCNNNILMRHRFTSDQSDLPAKERKKNVKNAFSLDTSIPKKIKSITIIDDVATTTSTILAATEVFKKSEINNINVITFARTTFV
jgi:ComF family protein